MLLPSTHIEGKKIKHFIVTIKITMTIYKQQEDGSLLITAPVMIPGAHDCDYKNGEPPLTREQIKRFAKTYEKYGFIDHEHGLTVHGADYKVGEPVKSFILNKDTQFKLNNGLTKTYPEGTWLVTSQITNPAAIEIAKNDGYSGYSASVFTRTRADEYLEALKSEPDKPIPRACKSLNSTGNSLIKDIQDPVVLSISLVNTPCLHESRFCELNIDGENMDEMNDVKSLKSKVLSAMGMSEEAEVMALKGEVSELKETIESLQSDFQEDLKSMQDEFKTTLAEALKPVDQEAMKSEDAPEEDTEPEAEETIEEEEEEEAEAEEEVKAEKGQSKAAPIHDNTETAMKSKQSFYEVMGKNPDGTRKK